MKQTILNLSVILFLSFSAFNFNHHSKKKTVTVSILPQKYFIERIAGNDFKINVLIPSGANPATYDPTFVQMKNISLSSIYFRIGYIPFEIAWAKNLTAENNNIKIINLAEGVDLIKEQKIRHGNHNHESGIDPHIWTSPAVVKQITKKILKNLIELAPDKKTEYENNYKLFIKDIEKLDNKAKMAFADNKNHSFIIYHPAMSYFARDYNLNQIPIELEGKTPSPKHIKHIISKAKKLGIRLVLIQNQFSIKNAQAIAHEINGEVQTINPLSENWLEEMYRIVNILKTYTEQ